MITVEKIGEVQSKIVSRFVEQVRNGHQSRLGVKFFACGQFLELKEKSQRGAHGTAAALRVISDSASEGYKNKDLVEGLISYLKEREEAERKFQPSKVEVDQTNVIKISEILYALSFVKPGLYPTDDYKSTLYNLLASNRIDDKGWGYYLKDCDFVKILPTAFAVMGLNSSGYSVESELNFLTNELDRKLKEPVIDPTQFSKYVFALYVLVFSTNMKGKDDRKKYRHYFNRLTSSPISNLTEDLEQNVEYWPEVKDVDHAYIRIPWQLYLIAIASKLSPWYFSKLGTQQLLNKIVAKSLNGGYTYPHSGRYLSARTQAILFEVLSRVEDQLDRKVLYQFYNFIDKFLSIFRTTLFRSLTFIVISIVFLYSIFKWINTEGGDWISDLGPELLSPILFWIYAISRNSKK